MVEKITTMLDSSEKIRAKALELGFSFCGFAKATALEKDKEFFEKYLREKRNAGLHYLERDPEKRSDPRLAVEGAQSVIALMLNYYPVEILPEADNFIISKYAYGKDYHIVVKKLANTLIAYMKEEFGTIQAKPFVDSGQVLEKAWARQCGIGWTGKNTLVINPEKGSFFFIAIILTDLLIEPDQPETDHCGYCHKCMDACPTRAIEFPYQLNPAKCISYLTIEEFADAPEELRSKLKGRIYGCDICQDACPYNRFAVPTTVLDFLPDEKLISFRRNDWLNLTKEQFDEIFKDSPLLRKGYDKLMRNIHNAAD
jgi:epoxyqueuosine reductase